MFQDSANIPASRAPRLQLSAISYDKIGIAAFVADAVCLLATAALVGEAFEHLFHGSSAETLAILPVALIPVTLLLAALALDGAYGPDRVANPRDLVRRAVRYWVLAQIFLAVALYLLKSGAQVDARSLAAFAIVAPAAFLAERRIVTKAARSAISAGRLKLPTVFLIVEGADLPLPARPSLFRPHLLSLPSLSTLDRACLSHLVSSIRASDVDEVHLISKSGSLEGCEVLLAELRKVPQPVKLVASATYAELLKCPISRTEAGFAFEVQRAPLTRLELSLKRGFDVILASLLGLALALVILAAAVLVRATSPGPVLFRQARKGFNGRPFTIYKFRTMTVHESGPVVAQATRDDPRVTPVGRLLRRTSIDELPQLLNVLRGDMSLIGPRPHAVAHDDAFADLIASYAVRQRVKPGITGWAQVCGSRGETPTPDAVARRVELDLSYIERWSLWLDIWIALRTLTALIGQKNAY